MVSVEILDFSPDIPPMPSIMTSSSTGWRSPVILLMAMAAVMQIGFAAWTNLSNNFAVEILGFTGREIGIQQSVREIPGFMAFAAVFFLLIMREQTLAYISLLLLGGAVAVTGYYSTFSGFLLTTLISSIGFHYYETMHQSLSLQWLPKKTAPATMGKILSVASFAQLCAFGLVYLCWKVFNLEFSQIFAIVGGLTFIATIGLWLAFPKYDGGVTQHKKLLLRKRYWLYYALTFMGGARRQIFVVFAAFMMVERFGFKVHEVAVLFIANGVVTMFFAPLIGRWIIKVGERKVLIIEYIGLFLVFTSYAFVSNIWVAVGLYIADHALFSMAIGIKTYFQKIADPADIAPTAGVSFTINHIAAVVIPVVFGLIWIWSPAAVFLAGSAMALISLGLAQMIPLAPDKGREFRWLETKTA
jgi:predicted MFS family arabinose efflux permease